MKKKFLAMLLAINLCLSVVVLPCSAENVNDWINTTTTAQRCEPVQSYKHRNWVKYLSYPAMFVFGSLVSGYFFKRSLEDKTSKLLFYEGLIASLVSDVRGIAGEFLNRPWANSLNNFAPLEHVSTVLTHLDSAEADRLSEMLEPVGSTVSVLTNWVKRQERIIENQRFEIDELRPKLNVFNGQLRSVGNFVCITLSTLEIKADMKSLFDHIISTRENKDIVSTALEQLEELKTATKNPLIIKWEQALIAMVKSVCRWKGKTT